MLCLMQRMCHLTLTLGAGLWLVMGSSNFSYIVVEDEHDIKLVAAFSTCSFGNVLSTPFFENVLELMFRRQTTLSQQ